MAGLEKLIAWPLWPDNLSESRRSWLLMPGHIGDT